MEGAPQISYAGGAVFERICPICCRFVKADREIMVNGLDEIQKGPNAVCKKHGRVEMPFIGWFCEQEFE
jgi:hypothetical protein